MNITPEIINTLTELLWGTKENRGKIEDAGLAVVPSNFYSTVPSLREIGSSFEYASETGAPNFEESIPPYHLDSVFNSPEEYADLLDKLASYSSEFSPPEEGDETNVKEFFWNNSQFTYSDAMAYYAFIRHFKPKRVLEIGAGFSSLVAAEALRANGEGSLVCIEPFPKDFLEKIPGIEIIQKKAQDISPEQLNSMLGENDFLFIDSTHTVKTGSDCLHIYLRLLPQLKIDNIFIHVHDVFLPFGLPKHWLTDHHIYWTEQYLLLAFLTNNPKAQFLYGNAYHEWKNKKFLENLMHGRAPIVGGSFWFRYGSNTNNR